MIKNFRKFTFILILFCLKINLVSSEVITKIEIVGNERISNETIIMFSDIKTGDDLKNSDLNIILKNLYDSNFFNNVSVGLTNNLLSISVEEAPLIQNITLTGIKAKKFEDLIIENRILKPKSSFILASTSAK